MRILFIAALLALVLGMLFAPSLWVARRLQQRGDWAAPRSLRVVWPLQLIVAAGLCLLADGLGFRNPAGYTVASIVAVSLFGAAMLGAWRMSARAWRQWMGGDA